MFVLAKELDRMSENWFNLPVTPRKRQCPEGQKVTSWRYMLSISCLRWTYLGQGKSRMKNRKMRSKGLGGRKSRMLGAMRAWKAMYLEDGKRTGMLLRVSLELNPNNRLYCGRTCIISMCCGRVPGRSLAVCRSSDLVRQDGLNRGEGCDRVIALELW